MLFAPGAALVAFGAAVLLLPDLLRFLVGGLFLGLGALLLGAAWQMSRGGGPPGGGFAMFTERFRR